LRILSSHQTLKVEARLVFSNKKLGFDPALEDLRQRYYKELKVLINPQKSATSSSI
jgi:hypothetical protein